MVNLVEADRSYAIAAGGRSREGSLCLAFSPLLLVHAGIQGLALVPDC